MNNLKIKILFTNLIFVFISTIIYSSLNINQSSSSKKYVVKTNETLWIIAGRKEIYNNSLAWPVIFKANRDLIKNPNSKIDGLTLSIPNLSESEKLKYERIRAQHYMNELSRAKRILSNSKQLLVVTSKDWDSTKAYLSYYERKGGKLKKIGDAIPVNLGRSGLGWGLGMVDFNSANGPIKKEGDGRAPAGIFKLSYAFGYQPIDSVKWINFPYKQLTKSIECVDDTTSQYYNSIVNSSEINKTWNSSEVMKRDDNLYKYGIFVEHNSNPQVSGCGSCIFIHIWRYFGKPTAGCTSMDEDQLVKILHWINVKKKPILIQMPEEELKKINGIIK